MDDEELRREAAREAAGQIQARIEAEDIRRRAEQAAQLRAHQAILQRETIAKANRGAAIWLQAMGFSRPESLAWARTPQGCMHADYLMVDYRLVCCLSEGVFRAYIDTINGERPANTRDELTQALREEKPARAIYERKKVERARQEVEAKKREGRQRRWSLVKGFFSLIGTILGTLVAIALVVGIAIFFKHASGRTIAQAIAGAVCLYIVVIFALALLGVIEWGDPPESGG